MNLVLVESPTKSKTISRFLGKDFQVEATLGHVRDLPTGKLGINVKKDFEPEYVIPDKAKKTVAALKKLAKKADLVILATDEDREGEAISWHLVQALALKKYQRIAFHEITQTAIEAALKKPREIDINLVNAQQARRVLDRLVGYKLSPFLWKKIAQGLSAGRVQSVAAKLICDREKEIEIFKPDEYWTVKALLEKETGEKLEAALTKKGGKTIPKLGLQNKGEAEKVVEILKGEKYVVSSVERKEVKKAPPPAFTTSSLQQEAWQKLHFPAKFTMSLAQKLYEQGLITYHRTDSLNLSEESLTLAKDYIIKNVGTEFWPGFSRRYKTKSKSAQEAHEAIRPTDPFRDPPSIALAKEGQSEAAPKLYSLIWSRFLSSQMSEAVFDSTRAEIKAGDGLFEAKGQILKFPGFLSVYTTAFEENELPELTPEENLKLLDLLAAQHFTQPPGRYSEATLIKALEKFGIGRPSTYAPILETIQLRGYVQKDEKKFFFPTEIGNLVNNLLSQHFPQIVDTDFTAKVEADLDKVSSGEKEWVPLIGEFYGPFAQNLKAKEKEVSKKEIMEEFNRQNDPGEKKTCELCGAPMVLKISRFGKFYACSKYPECKYTQHVNVSLGVKCPKCQEGEMVERRTKKRKIFYGCSLWPKCDFALWDKPTGEICPNCQGLIVKTKWRKEKCSNKDCPTNQKADAPTSA